jgi:hypothetical protein
MSHSGSDGERSSLLAPVALILIINVLVVVALFAMFDDFWQSLTTDLDSATRGLTVGNRQAKTTK